MSELVQAVPAIPPLELPPVEPRIEADPGLWERTVLWAKKTGAIVTAMANIVAPMGPAGFERPETVLAPIEMTVNTPPVPLPTGKVDQCPPVKPRAIIFADKLLAGGENPRFIELRHKYEMHGRLMGERHPEDYGFDRARLQLKHELADELDLHVFDIPDDAALEDDLYPHDPDVQRGKLSFGEYFARTKTFLAQYGIELTAGEEGKEYAWNNVGPSPKQLDTFATKENLYTMMRFFADLPKEFVEMAGIHKMTLTTTAPKIPKGGRLAVGMTEMGAAPRTMYINISASRLIQLEAHEFGHALNAGTCGSGAGNDPEFVALNGGNTYDVSNRPDTVDVDADTRLNDLSIAAWDAHQKGDIALETKLQKQLAELKAKVAFVSNAGNLAEDLADTGGRATLTGINYAIALDDQFVLTEGKFILLFARIAQYNPKVAVFLARYSRHGEHEFGLNLVVQRALDAVDGRTTR